MELPGNLAVAIAEGRLQDVPCSCLSASARSKVTFPLKLSQDGAYCSSDHLQDWRGLAEIIGLSPEEVDDISSKVNINYAEEVFKRWPLKGGFTMGKLAEHLTTLERYDILEDASIIRKLVADASRYTENMRKDNECKTVSPPDVVTRTESDSHLGQQISMSNNIPGYRVDEFSAMVTDDVMYNQRTLFDAFVCYVEEDIKFVRRLMRKLESGKDALKLCVEARDLLVGQAHHCITAQLIQQRCKKVIIVLSKKFLQSDICDFQLKFAHHLSPGAKKKRLVPIVLEKELCEKDFPLQLTFVTKLFYDRPDTQEWFWPRLKCSVRADLEEVQEESDNWGSESLPCNADPDSVSICADKLPSGSLLIYPPSSDSSSCECSDSDASETLSSSTESLDACDSEQRGKSAASRTSSSPRPVKAPASCRRAPPGGCQSPDVDSGISESDVSLPRVPSSEQSKTPKKKKSNVTAKLAKTFTRLKKKKS